MQCPIATDAGNTAFKKQHSLMRQDAKTTYLSNLSLQWESDKKIPNM